MRGPERNRYGERRAAINLAVDAHGAGMQLHKFLHERQADAAPFVGPTVRPLYAMKSLEQVWHFFRRNTNTRIPNVKHRQVTVPPDGDRDLALEREFEGVRQQIENDLFPHVAVNVDRLVERWTLDDELEPGALDGGAKCAREIYGNRREIDRRVYGLQAPRFNPREIEEDVHEAHQSHCVAVNHLKVLTPRSGQGLSGICQLIFKRTEKKRQRSTKLVAHVAEERGFGAIELGQRLGALALRLIRSGVDDRRSDVAGDEIEKRPICRIRYAPGAHADNEQANHAAGSRSKDGQNDGLARRLLPWATNEVRGECAEIGDVLRLVCL